MRNLKEKIEEYIPFNNQEVKDKEIFLKYIDDFEDILTRKNEYGHLCSSAFILNKDRTKVLMIYHNIYDSWGWVGGHADGNSNLLHVALKETEEETGLINAVPITNEILAIDTLPVLGHVKRGSYVAAHVHLSVVYLLEASEDDETRMKIDENSGVKWISIDEVVNSSSEAHMKYVYQKIVNKLKEKGIIG